MPTVVCSMMVDELVGMRVTLSRKLEEAEEALKVLLAEHDLARQHTLNMYRLDCCFKSPLWES